MRILIHRNKEQAIQSAAEIITRRMQTEPDVVLGLATGGTMEAVYAKMIEAYQAGEISFSKVQSFNLDEYVGLPPKHPCSYWHYMREHLFSHVDIREDAYYLPKGDAPNARLAAKAYEQSIVNAGDIGLQLLGIGSNGHIGFNEPTSSLASLTRVKTLTHSTREANARYFDNFDDVPRLAITMGIGTIMRAEEVVLLAYGESKAPAVAAMIEGGIAALCPASILQMHQKVSIILDEEAAGELKLRDYYEEVHPNGVYDPF